MTSINEINVGENNNMHYYDPKENSTVSLIPKQLYPMHVKEVTTRVVDVRGKYKAKVYNVIYEVAEECGKRTFLSDKGEINGQPFVGKKVYGSGIFMFLNPKPGDTFEANNGANERYLRFCETLKVDCPEVEVVVDGEKRMVKQFPELQPSEMIGKSIMGYVDIEEYTNRDGEKKMSYKVKDFSEWAEGKDKDFEIDALPF
tara:strand:- start:342 stop:944 length:603 start_codon:yes stop_codon:yes gene_type:complete